MMFGWIKNAFSFVFESINARLWRAYTYPEKSNEQLLFQAAEEGRLDWIKHLVRLKVNLNCRKKIIVSSISGTSESTALHVASQKGHTSVVRYLLSLPKARRPHVSALDSSGHTPLFHAIDRNHSVNVLFCQINSHEEIINLFLCLPDEEKPDLSQDPFIVIRAIEKANLNALRKMAKFPEAKRPNFNKVPCRSEESMFHFAARYPVAVFQFLYELPDAMRPDITLKDSSGFNAFQHACQESNFGVIQFILTHPDIRSLAPRDAKEQEIYIKPLLRAAEYGHLEFIKFILELDETIRPDITKLQSNGKPLLDKMIDEAKRTAEKRIPSFYALDKSNLAQKVCAYLEEYKKSQQIKTPDNPLPLSLQNDHETEERSKVRP